MGYQMTSSDREGQLQHV